MGLYHSFGLSLVAAWLLAALVETLYSWIRGAFRAA